MTTQPARSASPDAPWRLDRLALRMALNLNRDSEPLPTQIQASGSGLFGPDGKPIVHQGESNDDNG